jgi:hypothetical protein
VSFCFLTHLSRLAGAKVHLFSYLASKSKKNIFFSFSLPCLVKKLNRFAEGKDKTFILCMQIFFWVFLQHLSKNIYPIAGAKVVFFLNLANLFKAFFESFS